MGRTRRLGRGLRLDSLYRTIDTRALRHAIDDVGTADSSTSLVIETRPGECLDISHGRFGICLLCRHDLYGKNTIFLDNRAAWVLDADDDALRTKPCRLE